MAAAAAAEAPPAAACRSPRSRPPPRRRAAAAPPPAPAAAPPPARRRARRSRARSPPPAAAAGAGRRARGRAGDDHAAAARRGRGQGRDARGRRAPGRPRARARADPQPVGDRRQLRDRRRRAARGLVLGPARHGLPRPVRLRRHVRAGGRDPPPPAAHRPRPRRGSGSCEVVAHSKAQRAHGGDGAADARRSSRSSSTTPRSSPSARPGRRKANFKVAVAQQGQRARLRRLRRPRRPTTTLASQFTPPAAEVAPGETVADEDARQAAQADLDRPPARAPDRRRDQDRRRGRTRSRPPPAEADEDGSTAAGVAASSRARGSPASTARRLYKPQVYKPNVHLGPGGVQIQKPMVRGPQMLGPQARANLNLNNLKMPGAQAPPAITGPLLPTQAVFRQKPWLPWWVAIVIPLLALLALLLFLFLPKNVEVPDVVGKTSTFEAEKLITEAKLELAPQTKEKVDPKAPPGTVVSQTPKAGETAEEGSEVDAPRRDRQRQGRPCPNSSGRRPARPRRRCARPSLTLGQATPQPVDPKATIKSQIPAPKEIVKEGAPVDIFLVVPKEGGGGEWRRRRGRRRRRRRGGRRRRRRRRRRPDQRARDRRRRPRRPTRRRSATTGSRRRSSAIFDRGRRRAAIIRVDPEPGTEVEAGTTVTLFVSAGFPQLAYDNDKDVLLVNGARRQPARADRQGLAARAGPDVELRRQRRRVHERRPGLPRATARSPTRRRGR